MSVLENVCFPSCEEQLPQYHDISETNVSLMWSLLNVHVAVKQGQLSIYRHKMQIYPVHEALDPILTRHLLTTIAYLALVAIHIGDALAISFILLSARQRRTKYPCQQRRSA